MKKPLSDESLEGKDINTESKEFSIRLVFRLTFSIFVIHLEDTFVQKSANKFAFSLTYSYLCTQILRLWIEYR